ncbi:MAG: DUF4105 domain-containing protein, partial [Sphingobacteriales bacterium]
MLKRSIITVLFLINCYSAQSQTKVSILYCGIKHEVYTIFGHVGIRVVTPASDLVFNYGTFDTSTENFLQKYIKGTLEYSLSVEEYGSFVSSYIQEDRTVVEHMLNLSEQDASLVSSHLISTYNTADRYYAYQFLRNNCTDAASTPLLVLPSTTLPKNLPP